MVKEKSFKTFLRIKIESNNPQEFLRSYVIPVFAEIRIQNESFQRFKNVSITTEVNFQIIKKFNHSDIVSNSLDHDPNRNWSVFMLDQ